MEERAPLILVADDDEVSGRLAHDLLDGAGFSVHLLGKSIDIIPAIKQAKPDMVVMDITLSGMDGLKVIRMIKSDLEISAVRIVVVSENDFEYEKQRAFKYGVEAFIKKPFNVDTFASQISQILSGNKELLTAFGGGVEEEEMPGAPHADDTLSETQARITVWGCRGFAPEMPNLVSAYGKQTSCVAVETRERLVIFDGGSGIIPLGRKLLAESGHRDIWILLTHFHLGHVMGLPYFPCLANPAYTIRIAGAGPGEDKFAEAVRGIFYASPWWHAPRPRARILIYEMSGDVCELAPGIRVRTMQAHHPSMTLCYRLEAAGKKIVYAPDSGLFGDAAAMQAYDEKLGEFCRRADAVIHDACFTDEDWQSRREEGHSSPAAAMEFAALQAEAKNLVLFHYDGAYSDETVDKMTERAARLAKLNSWETQCHTAREGFSLTLE
ncbi:MAG: response regulator [Elusimicrobiales bacterium]